MSTNGRSALGGLSSNAVNSRKSMMGPATRKNPAAAGRKSMAYGLDTATGRKSMAPRRSQHHGAGGGGGGGGGGASSRQSFGAAAMRRQSQGAASSRLAGGGKVRNDPRPIGKKDYRIASIHMLIQYLTEHGYDRVLSPKILSSPTSKDFYSICEFLYRRIDANFRIGDKPADAVLQIFSSLKYPFGISKRALSSVGSPHTWPYLLAALTWLVELLTYDELVQESAANGAMPTAHGGGGGGDDADGDDGGEALFFDYLEKAYRQFLDGEDDYQVLEADLQETFERKNIVIVQETEELSKDVAVLRGEYEALCREPSKLDALTAKRDTFEADKKKFLQLIENLQVYMAKMRAKIEANAADLTEKEAALDAMTREKARLEGIVAQQDTNSVDAEKIQAERGAVETALAAAVAAREDVEKKIWDLELDVTKKVERVEKRLAAYHELAAKLQLVPANAKYAAGRQFEIALNPAAADPQAMLSVDLKADVRPFMAQLRQTFSENIIASQSAVHAIKDERAALEEAVGDKRRAIDAMEAKLAKLDALYKREKEAISGDVRRLEDDVEAMESQTRVDRAATQKSLDESRKRQTALAAEHAALRKRLADEKEAFSSSVLQFLENVTQHKVFVQNRLIALEQRLHQAAQDAAEH